MNTEAYIELGVIQRIQGLKGMLLVSLHYDISTVQVETIFIQINYTLVPYVVERLSGHPQKAFIKLQGIDNRENAYYLKGLSIFVPREALPQRATPEEPLEKLIGYHVNDIQKGHLGKVQDIYAARHQELLAIDYQGRELLVPYHKQIVTCVDHEQKNIVVHLPIGFIEAIY
jgi:16S rRNA processing protein RimM